jgi:hypothetical protein
VTTRAGAIPTVRDGVTTVAGAVVWVGACAAERVTVGAGVE